MKKSLIVANWKMNPATAKEARILFNSIEKKIGQRKNIETIICPPFTYLSLFKSKPSLKLGSQNVFWEELGAYTGEISAIMLKKMSLEYAIIGHSERRKYFKESNQQLFKKIKSSLSAGLKPILCIDKISQLPGKSDFKEEELTNIIIAYEPLFAIGTGKACSPKKAGEKRKLIKYPQVLYGGSVNSQNALSYLKEAGFQGLLIGGASLKAQEFIKIIDSVEKNC